MIRRGFWLTAGAVAGIYGYRRASAVARRLSATLNPGSSNPGSRHLPAAGLTPAAGLAPAARLTGRRARRGALALARQTYRFSCDVREGMELYRLGHSVPATPAVGDAARQDMAREDGRTARGDGRTAREDGRTARGDYLRAGPTLSTADHDAHPEDGY